MLKPDKKEGGSRQLAPTGTHRAVLYKLINLGTLPVEWNGETKKQHKIRLIWELTDETIEYEKDGEKKSGPIAVGRKFTFSMSDKGLLLPIVTGIVGGLTEDERWNFDIESLLGQSCLVTITHEEYNGTPYAKIVGASMLPKGMEKPTQINPTTIWDVRKMSQEEIEELDDYIKDDMKSSDEYHVRFEAPRGNNENDVYKQNGVEEIGPDDIPFN